MLLIAWALAGCAPAERVETFAPAGAGQRPDADTGAPPPTYAVPGWPHLLAYHSCDFESNPCGNPANHRIHLAGSFDGLEWEPVDGLPDISASVPDILYREGLLYLYAVPNLFRYEIASGTWLEPELISIQGTGGTGFVDPCAVLDEDGGIRLFFLHADQQGDPASCPAGEASCTKSFRVASEEPGSDGAVFGTPSEVLSVELGQGQIAADPEVFAHPGGYLMYISRGQAVQVFSSPGLEGPFELSGDLPGGFLVQSGGVPSGRYDPVEGLYWTLVTRHVSSDGRTDILLALHEEVESLGSDDFVSLGLLDAFGETGLVSSPGLLYVE